MLGLSFLGIFLCLLGFGFLLGAIYATIRYGIPAFISITRMTIDVLKAWKNAAADGIRQGNADYEARQRTGK